ncbi:PDZ domain-containing protein [Labedella populi]|uniref:PDZ domain-containing protein n=1 Tax=Labedella populi TaxID=2498850 RepID=A0A3S4C8Y0_9MICO|nr:trypsin-like peptidase domain-containing protein [Labedella populi]RWZ64731.1 PDZ domain-containing protein [Labedella populi]
MTENTTGSNEPVSENHADGTEPMRPTGSPDATAGASGSAPSSDSHGHGGWPADVPPRPADPSITPHVSGTGHVVPPAANGTAAFAAPSAPTHSAYAPGAASAGAGRPGDHRDWHPQAGGQPTGPSVSRDAFGNPTYSVPTPQGSRSTTKRRGSTMLVAGLAIGALVGGASGAGTFALVNGLQSPAAVTSSAGGTQNVTINDTNSVNRTTAVAAKASPSVVTIAVAGSEGAGTGSGIILSDDGYVLTNNHVVTLDGSVSDPSIQVTDNSGRLYSATIVGTDPVFDLAVIKLGDAEGLTSMEFADSSNLNVGDTVVAIGAPLGLAGTVTDGIVSALNRSITVASSAVPDTTEGEDGSDGGGQWGFEIPGQEDQGSQATSSISLPVVQTDAAINPGNSGGALVDDNGELIGVNVAIASAGSSSTEQSGSIGVGFAIPSNVAERIANEIIDEGEASHGLLGATVGDSSTVEGSNVAGAVINEVTSGGAAQEAGIQSGDVVTAFNGVPITGATDLTAQVRALAAGATATVVYQRDGQEYTVDVTLGELHLQ